MKRVLVLGYSQTGQLSDILDSVLGPLDSDEAIHVDRVDLKPQSPYPFPWPFLRFFDTFPETVYEDVPPIQPLDINPDTDYDLIILGYQVWFLSPSQPATAFLQSELAAKLLKGRPVITVIGCRNMWLMAQETVKGHIERLGGHLIDNIVLTDDAHSAMTFYSTPIWMLTGNKGPYFGGRIPRAGVPEADIRDASRFGRAMAAKLPQRERSDTSPMLSGLGAVEINEGLIGAETVAKRSFKLWGGLLRFTGKPGALLRRAVLILYIVFLVLLILTVVPLLAVLKKLFSPFSRKKIARQKLYFAAPSGESNERAGEFAN
ncbi:hypothetical protein [Henriciella litoralis]|uniref:hypothetical protein n=1 Tax=Henriciella litoralis TaxID=568102 RepID=UPI0009FD7723|nr:hypothetical protein [Henriciella litoralis]